MYGVILVTDYGISVTHAIENGRTRGDYSLATIENLMDAARCLSVGMDLPHEDPVKEARRVQQNDQDHAEIRETIKQAFEEVRHRNNE